VSRNDLSKELRSSLKVHRTTAKLHKHADEIFALAHNNPYPPQSQPAAHDLLNRIFTRDGSADERAADILSRYGDGYDSALNACISVCDFFRRIGCAAEAVSLSALTDLMFRAAAFTVEHTQEAAQ
jgi:hypothetical protein